MVFVAIIPEHEPDTVELLVDRETAKRILAMLARDQKQAKELRIAARRISGWSGLSVDASARLHPHIRPIGSAEHQ